MNQPLPEDLEFLEHFGTKGMKWGVRRDARKDVKKWKKLTNSNSSRKGIVAKRKEFKTEIDRKSAESTTYAKAFKKANDAIFTRGEKAAMIGLGVAFLAVSPEMHSTRMAVARNAGKAYRMASENEVQRFLRRNGSNIASTIGENFVNVNNGFPALGR